MLSLGQLERSVGVTGLQEIPRLRPRRSPGLAVLDGGDAAEAFRALRASFRHAAERDGIRSVALVSALGHEGRSHTAANLACSLVLGGSRVLLVDGDFEKPVMHRWFGQEAKGGLADALVDGEWRSRVQTSNVEGLEILGAGRVESRSCDYLGSSDARRLFAEMRAAYDIVVVDTSAGLDFSSAVDAAARTDGALLVCRYGRVSESAVEEVVARLRRAGATPFAGILNGTPRVRHRPL